MTVEPVDKKELVFWAVLDLAMPPIIIALGQWQLPLKEPLLLLLAILFVLECFILEGILILYGLVRFDYAVRVEKELGDCVNDLTGMLGGRGISYTVTRLPRGRVIGTRLGSIFIVEQWWRGGVRRESIVFYPKQWLVMEVINEYKRRFSRSND